MTPDPISILPPTAGTAASERQSSGWDIRNAPRNYISLVAYQIGSAIFSFASVWLITHYLGSEGYGGIIAVIAASQVAQVLVNWTCFSVIRFGVDEFIETEKIARTFWVRFVILAVNLALVAALSRLWFPPLADWLKLQPGTYWLVIIHFSVTALWLHVQMSLQGAKMPRVQGMLQMIERMLVFAGLFLLIVLARLDATSAITTYIAAPAAMFLFGLIRLRDFIFARFSIDRVFLKKIFLFSVPLLPFTLVGYFSGTYVDAVFITKFLSTRDLGVYSVASQFNGIGLQLPTLINTLLLPFFVTLRKEEQSQKMVQYFRNLLPTLTFFWGLFSTLVCFMAFFVLPMVFGVEFADAIPPFWILFAASTLFFPHLAGYGSLSGSGPSTFIPMLSAIFAAFVNICFNFLLIPKFGMIGCAWATAIMYFVSSLTLAVLLRRYVKIPISWTFIAPVPAVCGAISFTVTKDPWQSLAVCLSLSVVLGYFQKTTFQESFAFLKRYRNEFR